MRGKQNNTSQLVLGAIMLAVFVVLYMVVPIGDKLIQSVLMVFTFIPITIYVVNCGRGYSAISGRILCKYNDVPIEVKLRWVVCNNG